MSGHRVQFADLPTSDRRGSPKSHKQTKSNLKVTSPEDAEHLSRRQAAASPNGTPTCSTSAAAASDPKASSRTAPRRHTVGGARSSREILAMQPSDMDKKREAFLEHLKQKYPHHASAIMGHQERLREQVSGPQMEQSRSPKHGPSPVPSVGELADQLSLASVESLDTMSEADAPIAFTRGSRSRASLPVVRSTNQTKDRSLGVLYLQYGDETKQIRMPNEITSGDTVRALFVGAFPQQLNMKMLDSPSMAVYVKDDMRNMYYELTDVRNITNHSCLKVYHKDPAQAFSHGPRPTNGDARMHREMYSSRDGQQQPHRQPPMGPPMGPPPHHPMQGSMSPPTPHSMPPSPSRIPFGPRQGPVPGSATMPRERMPPSSAPNARSASPCPSAILERRDVKPDEDMGGGGGGGKSHSLPRGNEGLYGDPYLIHEGRMGMAAAHGGPPLPGDGPPEHMGGGFHRASIRSTGSYGGPSPTDSMEHPSLYRQKSRNSQLPTLGSKTPPLSPHRMSEVRMMELHAGPPQHGMHMERSSPVRQSFRKEEVAAKSRSGMGSPAGADLQGHGALPPPSDPQTRDRSTKTASPSHSAHSAHSTGGSPILAPKTVAPPSEVVIAAPLHANLLQFRRNVCDLRLQLQQMRQLQLQNQEALRVQLQRAEQEISMKLSEALRRVEDPAQRQRVLVEEDRHKYLGLEESVLTQLGELEQYVDSLKKESSAGGGNRVVTLKDVEEGAVSLRRVGESLAGLKGEFPALQARMRAVLRVEVEAVKFLKEEPHKLDSMLKRVKSLTDSLSGLRRCATEGPLKASADPAGSATVKPVPAEPSPTVPLQTNAPVEAPPPQVVPKPGSPSALPEPQTSTIRSEVMPASPVVIHHVQSSPVLMQQSQQSAALTVQPSPPLTPSPSPTQGGRGVTVQPSPPLTPSPSPTQGGRDSSGSAKCAVSSSSSSTSSVSVSEPPSPSQHKRSPPGNPEQHSPVNGNGHSNGNQSLFIEELHSSRSKNKNRAMSIEAAEREWEERRQNMGHYDGREFEKILQEAQANMMKGIPVLDVGSEAKASVPAPLAAPEDQADGPKPVEPATDAQPQSISDTPAKPGPEKPLKSALEKPAKPAAIERPRPASGDQPSAKPATATTDKVTKLGAEKCKSPPPPPPRKTFPSPSGMTTTRSGEVVYTSTRKEGPSAQEGDEDAPPAPLPKPKPAKVPPETKPKPSTPPPIAASAVREEEDEGDKIMAELQVFQKCTVKDIGVKSVVEPARIEPLIRELRPGVSMPLKEKKQSSESHREDMDPNTDENGNSTVRQSPAVIYYVTGQISKEQQPPAPPAGPEEAIECREPPPLSPTQVSNVTPNDNSPSQQQTQSTSQSQTGPPVSPKPVGLNSFWSVKRSDPPKTGSVEDNSNLILNQINTEKRVESSLIQGSQPSSQIIMPASVAEVTSPAIKGTESEVSPPEKAANEPEESRDMCEGWDEEASLSQDLPGEAPPPPHNIAFMITNTKVQALSCGEYQQLVNAKKGSVRTVTVGNRDGGGSFSQGSSPQDNGYGNKKPVIIIFDEPMDIRSAYKRLSTIFECEEELERMLAAERIEEESEESDPEGSGGLVKLGTVGGDGAIVKASSDLSSSRMASEGASLSRSSSELAEAGTNIEMTGDGKTDGKKKFKFKFPKKQLAALSQAIRSGTKAGKKTLQVVVYEDEEESDGTVRQHKEAKRFEIVRSKSSVSADTLKTTAAVLVKRDLSESHCRTDDIRKSTYKTLDSLEQTIKQLETTISEMAPRASEEPASIVPEKEPKAEGIGLKRSSSLPTSASKSLGLKANKGPLKKKVKPQLLPRPVVIPTATVTAVPTQQVSL